MSDENEVVTPAEEVVVTPETQDEPQQPTPATEEDAKPVGEATIVELETPAEQFPAPEDNA